MIIAIVVVAIGVLYRSIIWREEWVGLRRCSCTPGVLVRECRMHMHRRSELVGKAVVVIDPVPRRSIFTLGHGSDHRCDQSHVWMASAPFTNFTVCRRTSAFPVGEDSCAAVSLLSPVDAAKRKCHYRQRQHAKYDTQCDPQFAIPGKA